MKFLFCLNLKIGIYFTLLVNVIVLMYHVSNGSLMLTTGNDVWRAGVERDRDGIDGIISSLHFLSGFFSLVRLLYGLRTMCNGFERHSLEKYFFLIFTVNIYDSIEFIIKMIVDWYTTKITGLVFLIFVLIYTTKIVHSYLLEKEEEFRFTSQRKKNEGLPMTNPEPAGF
mmetsp:Transcript_12126/g.13651  ORF Transcript_12126/g.13651 Transcript_12126/m.13651 type:complete len:170 (-) Transcript_12126:96-605(-)